MFIGSNALSQEKLLEPVDYVNPYIGNISHLLVPTFPTIHLPNSMMRVYPERRDYTDDVLHGLPLIVTSHRGSSAFNLSPFTGNKDKLKPVINFSYDNELITPYSYSVFLDNQLTSVNFAVSHQSAIYQLEFDTKEDVFLIVNSKDGKVFWDGNALQGFQLIENNTKVYLYLTIDELPERVSIIKNQSPEVGNMMEGENANVVLKFPKNTKSLKVRYGISFIDEPQAKRNFEREVKGKTLKELKDTGKDIWNKALGKIKIEGKDETAKKVFYTSLYRTYERPVCLSEDNRYYSAFDNAIHEDKGKPFYTDD